MHQIFYERFVVILVIAVVAGLPHPELPWRSHGSAIGTASNAVSGILFNHIKGLNVSGESPSNTGFIQFDIVHKTIENNGKNHSSSSMLSIVMQLKPGYKVVLNVGLNLWLGADRYSPTPGYAY